MAEPRSSRPSEKRFAMEFGRSQRGETSVLNHRHPYPFLGVSQGFPPPKHQDSLPDTAEGGEGAMNRVYPLQYPYKRRVGRGRGRGEGVGVVGVG